MNIKIIPPQVTLFTTSTSLVESLRFAERAGRNCYASTDRITEHSYLDFLSGQIVRSGHFSVLRHVNVSYEIVSSISILRQLMRHTTGTSFHQSSTRYQNYTKDKFANTLFICSSCTSPILKQAWQNSANNYELLIKQGMKAEDAREVLPLATASTLCITLNLQALRHIYHERTLNKHAQQDIRDLVEDMVKALPEYVQTLIR